MAAAEEQALGTDGLGDLVIVEGVADHEALARLKTKLPDMSSP